MQFPIEENLLSRIRIIISAQRHKVRISKHASHTRRPVSNTETQVIRPSNSRSGAQSTSHTGTTSMLPGNLNSITQWPLYNYICRGTTKCSKPQQNISIPLYSPYRLRVLYSAGMVNLNDPARVVRDFCAYSLLSVSGSWC